MQMIFVLFATLAPILASTLGLKVAHRGRPSTFHGSFMERGVARASNCWREEEHDPDAIVCARNTVAVLQQQNENGEWQRNMQFGNECAVQSSIMCKSTERCESTCSSPCPCDVDFSAAVAPYMQTMIEQLAPTCAIEKSKVLLLGLGGGRLAQYLLHGCPGMHVDAVELDDDVIFMARNYLGLGESERKHPDRIAVQQGDALTATGERVEAASDGGTYDAVLIDCAATGGEVPEPCRSRDLIGKIKTILKPKGIVLQNIWDQSPMLKRVAQEFVDTKTIYRDVFDGGLEDVKVPMPPGYNWMHILRATKMEEASYEGSEDDE